MSFEFILVGVGLVVFCILDHIATSRWNEEFKDHHSETQKSLERRIKDRERVEKANNPDVRLRDLERNFFGD